MNQDYSQHHKQGYISQSVESFIESLSREIHSIYLLAEQGESFRMDNLWKLSGKLIHHMRTDPRIIGTALFSDNDKYSVVSHSFNTAILAAYMGLYVLRDVLQLNLLVMTACIHDIGMVQIPDDILFKQTLLSNHEIKVIRRHPVIGNRLIYEAGAFANLPIKKMLGEIILQEHERDGGTGYPFQITAEQIHLLSTLLGICDTYETLTHARPWRQKMHPTVALREISRLSREYFPADYVNTFIQTLTYFPIGTIVKLNDGRIGEVIAVNSNDPQHPKIHIVDDDPQTTDIIDLHLNPNYNINQIIISE
ncbi:HD domain-containing protein [candidate division KSB1 bacterium]|nr:HD domain-containing protein [candidate division KSB1 bacterium]